MEYNRGLFELLGHDPRVYARLWNEFSQINPKTTIKQTEHYEITLPSAHAAKYPPPKVRVRKEGLRALIWRKFGGLTKKTHWVNRGYEYDQPLPYSAFYDIRTIRLSRYSWDDGLESGSIICGYDPQSDTLWVMPRS